MKNVKQIILAILCLGSIIVGILNLDNRFNRGQKTETKDTIKIDTIKIDTIKIDTVTPKLMKKDVK